MLAWSLLAVCVWDTITGFRRCSRTTRKCPWPTLSPGDPPDFTALSSPGALAKSCFSFLPIDVGTFAAGKQKRQGRCCPALPSAEPPTWACARLRGTRWEPKPPFRAHPSAPARSHAGTRRSCFAKLSCACWKLVGQLLGPGEMGQLEQACLWAPPVAPAHPMGEGQEG